MAQAQELTFQDLSTVAGPTQQKPVTFAAAATITPKTFLSFVTGTTAIATITPPIQGAHLLCLIFTTTQSGQFATTGNLTVSGTTATANVPQFFVYDPSTNKYYGKAA
jgi:hypothetical protein